jgi:peptide/nickel transport system substrate-binding protein
MGWPSRNLAAKEDRLMSRRNSRWVLVGLAALLVGCAPAASPGTGSGSSVQPAEVAAPAPPARTLSVVIRLEPTDLTDTAGNYARIGVALFGAGLGAKDQYEVPFPVLAESLPQLNTDTWRLFPDGRMETVYRLRSGLSWHDGTPLEAEDFVFGFRSDRERVRSGAGPNTDLNADLLKRIDEVVARDAHTLVIRWREPFAEATAPYVMPRPRHLLQEAFQPGSMEVFNSLPYWTTSYVGVGPYRMARWEPGAFIEASAFEGYALGRPRIDRVRLTWSGDPNSTLSRLLAGDADVTLDNALYFEQAAVLRRSWGEGRGTILLTPTQLRYLQVQFHEGYINPRALMDLRVRQAVFHAIDRKTLADTVLEGEGIVADSLRPPGAEYSPAVERAITRYPFDLRRTEELMGQAGFQKGPDGIYAKPGEGRFNPPVRGIAEGQEAQETTIVADFLKRAGMDASLDLVPAASRAASNEFKATFPAFTTNYAQVSRDVDKFISANVGHAGNQFVGSNRMGWSNPEYDRLYEAFNASVDRPTRNDYLVQMLKMISEELPVMPLYFNFEVVAHGAALRGPQPASPESTRYTNLHEWQWK